MWASPERAMWLLVLPVLVGWLIWAARARRRALAQFAEGGLWPQLADRVDWRARRLKAALVTLGVAGLVVSLLGPQWGFRWQEVKRRGVDVVIALDVSRSMLAEDVKPNRLARAKLAIHDVLPLLKGDRIGLVAFAGTAFAQCPLTADYGALALILDEVGPDSLPRGGTAIGSAIREGLKLLKASGSVPGSRAMVLISDGESLEGDPRAAAKEAVTAGVPIFCIGIGTPEGELIRLTDDEGRQSFLKDREGRTVKSRLDEALLQQVARETRGGYARATATSFGLDAIYREHIATLEPQEHGSTMQQQRELRFQWPLLFALLVLAGELLVSDRLAGPGPAEAGSWKPDAGSRKLEARSWMASQFLALSSFQLPASSCRILVIVCGLWSVVPARLHGGSATVCGGCGLVWAEEPRLSEERVERALTRRPEDPALHYNLGTLRYRQGDYARAADSLHQAMANATPALQGQAAYNLGNTRYRQAREREAPAPQEALGWYQQALDAYQLAIQQQPDDRDAQFNYELTQRRLEALRERQASSESQPSPSEQQQGQHAKQERAGQGQEEQAQSAHEASEEPGEQQQAAQPTESKSYAGQEQAQEQTGRQTAPSTGSEPQQDATPTATAPSPSPLEGERGGEGRASVETPQDMTKQQALWILDSLRQEERLARPSQEQGQAQEATVEQDW